MAWGSQIRLASQVWQVVEQVNHPHLGLALDSFHTLALRDDPAPIAQLPGDKIFFVQLADAPASTYTGTLAGLSATERFVQMQYLTALGRAGNTAELAGWVAFLNGGGSQAAARFRRFPQRGNQQPGLLQRRALLGGLEEGDQRPAEP